MHFLGEIWKWEERRSLFLFSAQPSTSKPPRRVSNPCDSAAPPCWAGNQKLVAKKAGKWFLLCSSGSPGNFEGNILGSSVFGMWEARRWEELLAVSVQSVDAPHLAGQCRGHWKPLSSSAESWKKDGCPQVLHFTEMKDFWTAQKEIFLVLFQIWVTLCKSNKGTKSWEHWLWFWETLNKTGSETWL